jgi:hypothetical protein
VFGLDLRHAPQGSKGLILRERLEVKAITGR